MNQTVDPASRGDVANILHADVPICAQLSPTTKYGLAANPAEQQTKTTAHRREKKSPNDKEISQ